MHPAEPLEWAVAAYVDGELLTDQAELERHMDEAIAAEQRKAGGDAAWAETLANRLAECDAEKGRLVKLYARGGLTDAEYDLHAAPPEGSLQAPGAARGGFRRSVRLHRG
jgi:hypothetical protein